MNKVGGYKMKCKNCGNEIVEGYKFCSACGNPVVTDDNNQDAITMIMIELIQLMILIMTLVKLMEVFNHLLGLV